MKLNSLLQDQLLTAIDRPFVMLNDLHSIDIAKTRLLNVQKLDRVGMSQIECPVRVQIGQAPSQMIPGAADAYVNLDEAQKGIHMSRLFLTLTETLESKNISPLTLSEIANDFLKSHAGISTSAHVRVQFPLMLKRPALLSQNSGWRTYPVSLWCTVSENSVNVGFDVSVLYSSTCPCSAALARQLIQKRFSESFNSVSTISHDDVIQWLGKEESIAGTPHGQRSLGKARILLSQAPNNIDFVVSAIESMESALATPVQTAVKREDEQEFARLNASNLMFAEDAVRKVSQSLQGNKLFKGTACEVRHFESLHPHDAVAKVATGELTTLDMF